MSGYVNAHIEGIPSTGDGNYDRWVPIGCVCNGNPHCLNSVTVQLYTYTYLCIWARKFHHPAVCRRLLSGAHIWRKKLYCHLIVNRNLWFFCHFFFRFLSSEWIVDNDFVFIVFVILPIPVFGHFISCIKKYVGPRLSNLNTFFSALLWLWNILEFCCVLHTEKKWFIPRRSIRNGIRSVWGNQQIFICDRIELYNRKRDSPSYTLYIYLLIYIMYTYTHSTMSPESIHLYRNDVSKHTFYI